MTDILYEDVLVRIDETLIVLKNYYFPSGKQKTVFFADVLDMKVEMPNMTNGKYRIWGTGDFRTWYPMDSSRSRRDNIFRMKVANSRIRIGFTVEDSARVIKIFQKKGLLK
jgi:hypothetical protein